MAVDEAAPYQLSVTAPIAAPTARLELSSLQIHFGGQGGPTITIEHSSGSESEVVQGIDVGHLDVHATSSPASLSADLHWSAGGMKVLCGTLASHSGTDLKVGWIRTECRQMRLTVIVPGIVPHIWDKARRLAYQDSTRSTVRGRLLGRARRAETVAEFCFNAADVHHDTARKHLDMLVRLSLLLGILIPRLTTF